MRSTFAWSSATLLTLSLADTNTVLIPVISAMPTMSAAAVMAVRRGLRPALSRPNRPGTEKANSRPISPATGRATSGVSSAVPTKASSTPPRIAHSPCSPALSVRPSVKRQCAEPEHHCARDRELGQWPVRGGRLAHCRDRGDPRRADGGNQRRDNGDADADGERADPRGWWHTEARQLETTAAEVAEDLRASKAPTPIPSASPTTEESSPIATASNRTDPMTCLRLAPIARISASSRVRWATMMENVLRIRNTATNSATEAKPMRM